MKNSLLIFLLTAFFLPLFLSGQADTTATVVPKESPAESEKKKKESKIKAFEDIITEDAISGEGLWNVHKVDDKNFFEIPGDILGKEILVVSRISGFVKNLNFGGAGVKSRPQQVIRWEKFDNKLLLRSVSYNSVADEELPIYESVRNNNFEPIIKTFDIKALSKDSTGYVIEIDDLFNSEVEMIGAVRPSQEKSFGLKGVDKSRSFITSMKAFPTNIEVRHILTYKGSENVPDNRLTETLSLEMNQSFIVLPEEPWQPRSYDPRVGYFSIQQIDYGSEEQKAFSKRFITRWRLDPVDPEAYARGELVEPKKQIVYYLDPATPEKWRPYLIQGINDWQKAFEAAGFKNAIVGKLPPTKEEDPDWSPEDARYSVIRYITTDIQNAQGPHVHDPRTGEILESDIMWYHNVMNLLRNWFFIQTAAVNETARSVKFSDEVMGELIRFVAAHEVGHTLGLPHNMGSSVGYPVDSLRSKTFTDTHGTAPSIMDYARFNYIAQPEDGITNFYPGLGEYDSWSIIYGYKLTPEAKSEEEENAILNDWIKARADNPVYRYGRQRGLPLDHTAQTEDLGDDSMVASEYGVKNLKRILPNLIEWTEIEGTEFENLDELYNNVYGQFRRYLGHVTSNIGGVKEDFRTYEQDKPVYVPAPKEKQIRAMSFLDRHLWRTPEWIVNKEILDRIEPGGNLDRISGLQDRTLRILLNEGRLSRMSDNVVLNGPTAYSLVELFRDLDNSIFREFNANQPVDAYRRNLQRLLISHYERLLTDEDLKNTDVPALSRASLKKILKMAEKKEKDQMTAVHKEELTSRIEAILDNREG